MSRVPVAYVHRNASNFRYCEGTSDRPPQDKCCCCQNKARDTPCQHRPVRNFAVHTCKTQGSREHVISLRTA